jgi:hypothetical protein
MLATEIKRTIRSEFISTREMRSRKRLLRYAASCKKSQAKGRSHKAWELPSTVAGAQHHSKIVAACDESKT